jgi:hypothetical protein
MITAENQSAWQKLADDLGPQRPSIGKRVQVTSGKHKGKEGTVSWHGVNKFSAAWQYCSDAQAYLREMAGRYGYRVKVDTGSETFFVDADKVEVLEGVSHGI